MSQNSKCIHKSHNATILLYHLVTSANYRRVVFTKEVDEVLVSVCSEIEKRYDIRFLEMEQMTIMFIFCYKVYRLIMLQK